MVTAPITSRSDSRSAFAGVELLIGFVVLAALGLLMVSYWQTIIAPLSAPSSCKTKTVYQSSINSYIPEAVTSGRAHCIGEHKSSDKIEISLGEPLFTTAEQEQETVIWLKAQGLQVTQTFSNHILIDATGTFGQVEKAFHVTINDYVEPQGFGHKAITFYAPTGSPILDPEIQPHVDTIGGLDNYPSGVHVG